MHMFNKQLDFIAIGDITTDAFIKLKEAHVNCSINTSACELCMKFGDKVPFEEVHIVKSVGNSPNAAVSAARLGLSSSLITNVGDDQNGRDCVAELKKNDVGAKFVDLDKTKVTNFHYVLWYDVDRTILVHHEDYNYKLPKAFVNGPAPKWIYLSSVGSSSYPYHVEIAEYMKRHPETKLAFQPGTFQMKIGASQLKDIYAETEVFIVNTEESQRVLGLEEKGFTDIAAMKELLKSCRALGPKIVLITDGPKGAYMFDGDHYYFMPIYPDPKPPYERTGCGDAFASTFVSALLLGHTPLEALVWAPVNPMSVVQYVGAQQGLLTREQIEDLLKHAPENYKPREI
ncbi:MAG: carbohydrate kinase PfkB, ribokinase [Candidatus Taylorbacteria bacterium]|nr:carbohydrate kinase PfkB, ribokinase [Candidatus Taylorbacteria bacterium]